MTKRVIRLPSAEYLRSRFYYDSGSGRLFWRFLLSARHGWNYRYAGTEISTLKDGYIIVSLDRKRYRAARIIWKYMTNSDPRGEIDHKDTNRTNNRWANLRDATYAQNIRNSNRRRGRLLPKGVRRDWNKFQACICVSGRFIYLGSFATADEASAAYNAAAIQHHGEFARPNP